VPGASLIPRALGLGRVNLYNFALTCDICHTRAFLPSAMSSLNSLTVAIGLAWVHPGGTEKSSTIVC
jgi:hypothetical protein